MKVETIRFGALEIDEESIVTMPRGPLGFEEQTRYCLIRHRPEGNFQWLQSIESPELAFVVVNPSDFFAGYEIEISDADVENLAITDPEDVMALVIVTVAGGGSSVTANLAAPVVINSRCMTGMQIVLQDNRYSTEHQLVEKTEKKVEETVIKTA